MSSRLLRYGFLIGLGLGAVLLFLLASASSNTQAFERNYPWLLAVNIAIAAALLALVVALITRLVRRLRAKRFGARLMARFALAFALIGVAPGLLLYVVSVQFLGRSIETWFDVRVDRSLESGLSLGRAALEAQLSDLTAKTRALALELADVPESHQLPHLERMRERAGIHEALLVSATGRLIGATGTAAAGRAAGTGSLDELVPDLPSPAQVRRARTQRYYAVIEGDPLAVEPRAGLRTRVIVPIPAPTATGLSLPRGGGRDLLEPAPTREVRLLQTVQWVPASIAANAEALQSGYRDYQELSLARSGLHRIYTATLTLTLLLAVFAAIGSAILLATSMTRPLLQVAEGTRAVAEGDFRPVREYKGNDELNLLTRSFNAMTRQLAEARDAVEARSRELENARAYLERVLTNLSAGVIVLDKDWHLVTANYGASRILGAALTPQVGKAFTDIVPAMAEAVINSFADQVLAATPKDSWQQQIQVTRVGAVAGAEPLALLARGSRLPLDDGPGYVVVFDDITQVISAQRAVAWGEVARRLAHEIKNPLTPIQLAAERLQMKLADKLPPEQADVLVRGASTIVSQVAAMKRMVDDFRDYARVPPARLGPLDLNALIEEVAALYGYDAAGGRSFEARHGTHPHAGTVTIELKLATDLPRIEGDATQLRQVIHNLIANAQDALAARPPATPPASIVVRTEAVATEALLAEPGERRPQAVRLAIEDNGAGFPTNILRRAFEPYVTTKPGGTGLGLAMVKKIVDEHGARVELINRSVAAGGGAIVTIVFRRLATAEAAHDSQRRVA
ncbi:MAG TPA: ATP-binding protein [Burkholderiaceae bacterium]|nr:ATP-binding protein [Burkholderiaceae bacterium]